MKREILVEWDHKSLEHIYRHSISEQELENGVNGRILIRSTTRKAEKLSERLRDEFSACTPALNNGIAVVFKRLKVDREKDFFHHLQSFGTVHYVCSEIVDVKVTQSGSSVMNYHDAAIGLANPNISTSINGDYTDIRLEGGNNAHTRVWFDTVKVYRDDEK